MDHKQKKKFGEKSSSSSSLTSATCGLNHIEYKMFVVFKKKKNFMLNMTRVFFSSLQPNKIIKKNTTNHHHHRHQMRESNEKRRKKIQIYYTHTPKYSSWIRDQMKTSNNNNKNTFSGPRLGPVSLSLFLQSSHTLIIQISYFFSLHSISFLI